MGVDRGYKPASNEPTKDKGLYDKKRLKASRIYAKKSSGYGKKYYNESTGKMQVDNKLPKRMRLLTELPKGYKKSSDYRPSDVVVKIGKTAYGLPSSNSWLDPINNAPYNTGKKSAAPKKVAPKKSAPSRKGMK
jgi:hypothetical protein